MSFAIVNYTGNGSTTTYSITFPYITSSHVIVKIDNVVKTAGTDYTFPTSSTIQFTSAPATSTYVSSQGGTYDELHVIVVDEDGKFTGTQGTVLEKFAFVSKASDSKDSSGNSNYYKNVISAQSKYVYWMDHPTANGASN